MKFNKDKEILAPFVSIGISIFQSSISMRNLSGLSCPWQFQSRGHTGGCIKVSIFRLSRPSDPPLRIASPIASIVRARINTRITYCDKWKYISSAYSRRCGVRDYLLIDSFRYAHAHSGYAMIYTTGAPISLRWFRVRRSPDRRNSMNDLLDRIAASHTRILYVSIRLIKSPKTRLEVMHARRGSRWSSPSDLLFYHTLNATPR